MSRKPRVFIEGGIYHVYRRAARGEAVFADETEAAAFVDILRRIKGRDNLVIFAWVLMSNHYHIALRAAEVPLWRSIASIQGLTSKGFNRRYRVYRPLWQGRYNSIVVEDERYLNAVFDGADDSRQRLPVVSAVKWRLQRLNGRFGG